MNRTIFISNNADPGAAAKFKVLQPSDFVGSPKAVDPMRKDIPTFNVSPMDLAVLKTDDDTLFGQLVIYHEYQHYKQWLVASDMDRALWANDHSFPGITNETVCRFMWGAEKTAYTAECHLANSWGFTGLFGHLCEYVDTSDWDHAQFNLFVSHWDDEHKQVCTKYWAEEAHHPYADLF